LVCPLGDRNFANVRIIRRNIMEMFILIVMILGLGYAIVLVKDLQTDTTKLKSAVENVMKKFDDIIARLNKVKIPKKEEIKED
jgi:cytochrome c oxidase assembly protein Cox11